MTSRLAFNSGIYLVGDAGNTEFGGEDNFTTTLGTGYRFVLRDWMTWHVDIRDHMFSSDIINESQLTHNIELSTGVTWFFWPGLHAIGSNTAARQKCRNRHRQVAQCLAGDDRT